VKRFRLKWIQFFLVGDRRFILWESDRSNKIDFVLTNGHKYLKPLLGMGFSFIEDFAHTSCPRSAGSKELLNNFKILTRQDPCKSLSCLRACTKTKKRLVVILN
jgi:hypothetical protein